MKNKTYLLLAGLVAVHFSAVAAHNLPYPEKPGISAEVSTSKREAGTEATVQYSEVSPEERETKARAASERPGKREKKEKKKRSLAERILEKKLRNSFPELGEYSQEGGVNTLLLVIIAILLPPVAVALVDGIGGPFFLSILLTLLFYLPGLIYALWRIFRQE